MKTFVFTPPDETGIIWLTSSRTPEAMTLAWGAKARDRRRHLGPIFVRALVAERPFCPPLGRAAFLFRGKYKAPFPVAPPPAPPRPRLSPALPDASPT